LIISHQIKAYQAPSKSVVGVLISFAQTITFSQAVHPNLTLKLKSDF